MISSFKKKKRDGFTLVELLVVIAILAVLASVSVIGYLGFTKKAKVSNDVSLTTQMNRILQAEEAGGETFDTPHDAITALKEGGLDVTKLTPTADGYNYVYDVNGTNGQKMILVDENKSVIAPEGASIDSSKAERYFFFAGTEDEVSSLTDAGYSVYLKSGFDASELTVSAGLDVGDNVISTINYINETEKTALIRTASYDTTLNVYGPNDVVKHYGSAKAINIAEVKGESYHEFGDVLGNITLAKGRVEVESGASVSNVVIDKVTVGDKSEVSPTSDGTKVEVKKDAKVSTVQSKVDGVSASSVTSGEGASEAGKVEYNDTNIAYIGSTGYSDISSAITALKDGDTLVLTKNIEISDKLHIQNVEDITFDLNGKKITCNNNEGFLWLTDNASLTIKGDGNVTANSLDEKRSIFRCENNTHLQIINGCFTTDVYRAYGIFALKNSIIDLGINGVLGGPTIKSSNASISVNGSVGNPEATYNIYGGYYESTRATGDGDSNVIMISNADGQKEQYTVNIYDGTFKQSGNPTDGKSNILELRYTGAKEINIYGGKFYCNGDLVNHYKEDTTTINDPNNVFIKSN